LARKLSRPRNPVLGGDIKGEEVVLLLSSFLVSSSSAISTDLLDRAGAFDPER
jgi:hypothetical protein